MQSFFSPEFFARNRATLQTRIGDDIPIVITGNGNMQRGGDEPSAFYQDSNFWYLTGLNGADLVLVMDGGQTYVIVPGMSAVREAFDGAHDVQTYAKRSGIAEFVPEQEGWQRLHEQLRRSKTVATPGSPPPYLKGYSLHMLPYRRRLIARLKRMAPGLKLRDIRTDLAAMRSIKQPEELQALRRATDITGETLRGIADRTLSGAKHEYVLEAALSYGFRSRGADGHAFAPIVGAGTHSTTLHYLANNGPVTEDDLIVLDVGAEVEHYSADITRTVSQVPITGRKAAVWKAVAAAQDYAYSLVKPGALPRDYEQALEKFIGRELQKLGVIKDTSSEEIRHFFPHMTSHFLGLDTHDVGDYQAPWQAGMVITVEPGIYLPEEGIGVRIEDDVLITETGCEILSQSCPRELTTVQ
ncbi:MAG TPA: aminopeptidase P N-terminal domain-containing protein [Candidatus Saccharimonadales bacterium]|jgi:Xaa-Pro aminopeptidase